jgi:hypothetical protein
VQEEEGGWGDMNDNATQEFEDPNNKVKVAVTMFRRIMDWHG